MDDQPRGNRILPSDPGNPRAHQAADVVSLADFSPRRFINLLQTCLPHALQALRNPRRGEEIRVLGLFQADAQRAEQRAVKERLACLVIEVADQNPIPRCEGKNRLRRNDPPHQHR